MQSHSTALDTPEISDATTITSMWESAYNDSNTEVAYIVWESAYTIHSFLFLLLEKQSQKVWYSTWNLTCAYA